MLFAGGDIVVEFLGFQSGHEGENVLLCEETRRFCDVP